MRDCNTDGVEKHRNKQGHAWQAWSQGYQHDYGNVVELNKKSDILQDMVRHETFTWI